MRRTGLKVAMLSMVLAAALGTSGCSVQRPTWVYVGDGGELRLALCDPVSATAVQFVVANSDVVVPLATTVWSGPRVHIAAGSALISTNLPADWRRTGDLAAGFDGGWEYVDYFLLDGDNIVEARTLPRDYIRPSEWTLVPEPSNWNGEQECTEPYGGDLPLDSPLDYAMVEDQLQQTAAIAMPEDEFWRTISILETSDSQAGRERLYSRLGSLPEGSIVGFEAQLRIQLYKLDTAAVWDREQLQYFELETYEVTDMDLRFLQARTSVILGGKAMMDSVLAGGDLPLLSNDRALADLRDSARVATLRAGLVWDPAAIPLPIAMGANADGW